MKALSLSQPWLWAVLYANKRVENRDWAPPIDMIEQRIALHAAKSFDHDALPALWATGIETPGEYVKSAIVGVATIDRVVTETRTLPEDQKRWFSGEFGWILKDVRALARPIAWDGALGLWTVPPLVEAEIRAQLGEPGPAHDSPLVTSYAGALAAAGVGSATEWATANPGQHLWFIYRSGDVILPSCVCCGVVKVKDTAKKPNKPCRGIVHITMRSV